jgi:RNA polymerase-binding transcription factor DksA
MAKKANKKSAKAKAVKKVAAKKPAKKVAAKKAIKKVAKKPSPAKKVVAKKPVKKAAVKKPIKKVASKPTAKKPIAKKPTAKKVAPKKPAPKSIKKAVVKKATKQAPAKKVVAKKAAMPKPSAKPSGKASTKKVAANKSLPKPVIVKEVPKAKPHISKPVLVKPEPPKPVQPPKEERMPEPVRPKVIPFEKKEEVIEIVESKRYSDADLAEFKELIHAKLRVAKEELANLVEQMQNPGLNAGADTDNSYKTLEDGASTAEKEYISQLAGRQRKFIENLENALIRIENKTYGICRVTGKLISKDRLRAVPHTTLSMEAKLQQYK